MEQEKHQGQARRLAQAGRGAGGRSGPVLLTELRLGFVARERIDGPPRVVHCVDGNAALRTERRFRWSARLNEVEQFILHPVSNELGYGDGYWRRAGKRDAARVLALVEKIRSTS